MKAVAVTPGKKNSVHLEDIPRPKLTDIPGGKGVLVRVLKVGVDATDREINEALYGNAPPGDSHLVIGHESFGIVEEVGPNVKRVKLGDYVTATVRRPGGSLKSQIVEGIEAHYISTGGAPLTEAAQGLGKADLIVDASGNSQLAFDAMQALGHNGVLVWVSITGGSHTHQIPSDKINIDWV